MPKSQTLPLRIIISRVGESTPAEYGASKSPIDSAEAARVFWQSVIQARDDFESEKEHLVAILLGTKLQPKGYHLVSIGSLSETLAHPREVFRPAIVMSAYGVILMHNHPSGDPGPSQADRRMTRQMSEAAQLLQIQLLDHVIVGSSGSGQQPFFSFREAGYL